MLEEI